MKKFTGSFFLCFYALVFIIHPVMAWNQSEDECLGKACVSGWTQLDTPYGGANISAVAIRSPSLMVAANDSGVYRATFNNIYGTLEWRLLEKFPVTSIAIYVDSVFQDTSIYIGSMGRGLLELRPIRSTLRSPANGAKDVSLNPLMFIWPASVGTAPYTLIVSSDSGFNNWVFSSSMNTTYYVVNSSPFLPLTTYFWHVNAFNGGSPSSTWSFTTACSTCVGFTYMAFPDSVAIIGTYLTDPYVRAVAVDAKRTLYVISQPSPSSQYTVSRSVNDGQNWTNLGRPATNPPDTLTALTVDPQGRLFAGTTNGIFIYRSGSWDSVGTGLSYLQLPDRHINALASDDVNHLFAGTNGGAYYSMDSGATWQMLGGPGLPNIVSALAAGSPGAMTPIVGTETGMYEYIATTQGGKPAQSSMKFLSGNSLRFTTAFEAGKIDIRVYDARGVEKMRLVPEKIGYGDYEVRFDGARLYNGIYFVKIKAGSYLEIRRVLVTR
ncbi:MAG TPA: hypothetical protein VLX68_13500 [Chitinivibrionales bacterium]|nr:hypothetical protein [Chitinivibrionales bacterium]